ncbi:MAG: hypothetical protein H7256_11075 [Bdellovibrio sp.]|nr:hypothetical protein [Bdellovibrio sp.]
MKNLITNRFVTSLLLAALSIVSFQQKAFAWGARGHASICEAAVFLVKNQNLKEYLQNKPDMMGHLCNIPDIYWKSLSDDARKYGDPGHFMDVEILGIKVKEVPTDYKHIVETYTGTPNKFKEGAKIFSVPNELGSNWWRADQFYRRALEDGKKLKTATAPSTSKEEQDENFEYNKSFYNMIVNMGLMGHFVGDNGQPFHSTSDYDGYAAGHGGIHAYFEDSSVAYFGPDLVALITNKAKTLNKAPFLKPGSVVEKMRALGEISNSEMKDILKLDPMTKPSSVKEDKGMKIRTPAERKSAAVGFKKFEKLFVIEMARSAALLAQLWDQAYVEAGEPAIKAYKSYKYPLTPEFVMPDYFEIKVEEPKKK